MASAERQRVLRRRREDAGFVRVQLWFPRCLAPRLKAAAKAVKSVAPTNEGAVYVAFLAAFTRGGGELCSPPRRVPGKPAGAAGAERVVPPDPLDSVCEAPVVWIEPPFPLVIDTGMRLWLRRIGCLLRSGRLR